MNMPTTEKPAKPRSRSRKAADQKTSKTQAKTPKLRDHAVFEANPVSAMTAPDEPTTADVAAIEVVAEHFLPERVASEQVLSEQVMPEPVLPARVVASDIAPAAAAMARVEDGKQEEKAETVLSGEVIPPGVDHPAALPVGFSGIAFAYGEYSRKSWASGRFLVERLIAVRSFDEVIEIQGEFARQVCANFIVQSEKICTLYGEWALGFFRPLEKLATGPQARR
jgi:hypothetical protein